MRHCIVLLTLAIGPIAVSACDTATDPIIVRMPPRPDSTADSVHKNGGNSDGGASRSDRRALPSALGAALSATDHYRINGDTLDLRLGDKLPRSRTQFR